MAPKRRTKFVKKQTHFLQKKHFLTNFRKFRDLETNVPNTAKDCSEIVFKFKNFPSVLCFLQQIANLSIEQIKLKLKKRFYVQSLDSTCLHYRIFASFASKPPGSRWYWGISIPCQMFRNGIHKMSLNFAKFLEIQTSKRSIPSKN